MISFDCPGSGLIGVRIWVIWLSAETDFVTGRDDISRLWWLAEKTTLLQMNFK
jgi:hypothetical protein